MITNFISVSALIGCCIVWQKQDIKNFLHNEILNNYQAIAILSNTFEHGCMFNNV